uniref:Small ribosomal subunit protein mS33 n=1 Tax=Oryzias sinensis TaxID=183150 RepID=A0A8C7XR50_9TELE
MAALSNYALRMARLSSRIFGEVAHPTDSRSLKVVQMFQEPPLAKRKEVYDWYPQHKIYYAMTQKLRYMGLFRYGHQPARRLSETGVCWKPPFMRSQTEW